jgi:hypothetical protein
MQIALPSMPSLYIISFLYQACLEIHKVGGHILDRIILHNFAWELLQKVCPCYKFTVMMHWIQNWSISYKPLAKNPRVDPLFFSFVIKPFLGSAQTTKSFIWHTRFWGHYNFLCGYFIHGLSMENVGFYLEIFDIITIITLTHLKEFFLALSCLVLGKSNSYFSCCNLRNCWNMSVLGPWG